MTDKKKFPTTYAEAAASGTNNELSGHRLTLHIASEKGKQRSPLFMKVFDEWKVDNKIPPDNWKHVKRLENYLSATDVTFCSGRSVTQNFYGSLWKDFRGGAYVQVICDASRKIWANQSLAYQHSFALYFADVLQNMSPSHFSQTCCLPLPLEVEVPLTSPEIPKEPANKGKTGWLF